jgi:hypothetical protein
VKGKIIGGSTGKYFGLQKLDGNPIPEGEPWWVFRAKDKLAIPAIETYRALAVVAKLDPQFINEIDAHVERIRIWQYEHGSKLPD